MKVLDVDVERQRIGLSLRLNDDAGSGGKGWCEAAQSRCGAEPGPARPSAGRRWSGRGAGGAQGRSAGGARSRCRRR